MQPEICEEEEVKSPVIGKFKSVEVKPKRRWMRIDVRGSRLILAAVIVVAIISATVAIRYPIYPSLIVLPADDIARLIQATTKFNAAIKPINDEFSAVTRDITQRYGVTADDKPAVTNDGLLLGWVRPDGTVLDLKPEDRSKLTAAKAKADSAAAEPVREYNAVNLEIAKKNGVPIIEATTTAPIVPAHFDYEVIKDSQNNLIGYRVPVKK